MPAPHTTNLPEPDIDNRRNYYRVLHVQPEAPLEVIKASYRTLMTQLRGHPDLGGSHAHASLLNEAWGILSDAGLRAAYDRQMHHQGHLAPRASTEAFQALQPKPAAAVDPSRHSAAASSAAAAYTRNEAAASGVAVAGSEAMVRPIVRQYHCALCAMLCLSEPRPDSRCLRCNAPLAAMPEPGSPGHELLGRRGAARREQAHVAMLRIGWPAPELPVRWRDLSLTGVSFFAPQPVAAGQRIHLADQALEAVAEVVVSRPQGRLFSVHARLLTALMLQAKGVFISAQA